MKIVLVALACLTGSMVLWLAYGIAISEYRGYAWRAELAELWQQWYSILVEALSDDIDTVRGYDGATIAWKALETVAALAVMIRTTVHVLVYAAGTSRDGWMDDLKPEVALVADPINLPRPAWNDLSARVVCALLALWYAQSGVVLVSGYGPLVDKLRVAVMLVNGAVLLLDPLLFFIPAKKLGILTTKQDIQNHGN